MANPLQSTGASPLLKQLVQRKMGGNPGFEAGEPTSNLTPSVPKLRPPILRPRRFVGTHPRTALQPRMP